MSKVILTTALSSELEDFEFCVMPGVQPIFI